MLPFMQHTSFSPSSPAAWQLVLTIRSNVMPDITLLFLCSIVINVFMHGARSLIGAITTHLPSIFLATKGQIPKRMMPHELHDYITRFTTLVASQYWAIWVWRYIVKFWVIIKFLIEHYRIGECSRWLSELTHEVVIITSRRHEYRIEMLIDIDIRLIYSHTVQTYQKHSLRDKACITVECA